MVSILRLTIHLDPFAAEFRNRLIYVETKMTKRRFWLVAFLVLMQFSCVCLTYTPVEATLSDLTLCREWFNDRPITLPTEISSDEARICICGNLETNQDVYLKITWIKDMETLVTNLQTFSNGQLINCIEQDDGFEPGNYGVTVVMGKETLGLLEFVVIPSE